LAFGEMAGPREASLGVASLQSSKREGTDLRKFGSQPEENE
jgi:hypothetical protein